MDRSAGFLNVSQGESVYQHQCLACIGLGKIRHFQDVTDIAFSLGVNPVWCDGREFALLTPQNVRRHIAKIRH
jgi:hypothetical protein